MLDWAGLGRVELSNQTFSLNKAEVKPMGLKNRHKLVQSGLDSAQANMILTLN